MPDALRTARLRLDPWTDGDLGLLAALARTPGVMRHIGDGATWTDVRIHDVGAHIVSHWRSHGFGWRVARLDDGTAIGFIALSFAGDGAGVDPGEYEIGWWLAPRAWGAGLAREGATAVRDEAFQRVGAPSILARIAPANAASLAVAAAIGLSQERESTGRGGEPIAVLRLTGQRWREVSPDPRLASSSSARRTSLTRGRPAGSPRLDS